MPFSESKARRYHGLLIVLHWLIAAAIIGMIGLGIVMKYGGLEKSTTFQLYQWHKSIGLLILLAVLLRLLVRLSTHIPPLPGSIKKGDQRLAKLGHFALYAAMLIMPITGWLIVSSSVYGLPTYIFGWFEWPHIPNITGNKVIHDGAEEPHGWLAYICLGLIILHVLAVIKHRLVDRVNLLPRMGIGHRRHR